VIALSIQIASYYSRCSTKKLLIWKWVEK